jgi:hypothetical protein
MIIMKQLELYDNEKLKYCENREVHTIKCPKDRSKSLETISSAECDLCVKSEKD